MKTRAQINENDKWDLSLLCKSENEFNTKVKLIEGYIEEFKKFDGRLKNKKNIKRYLDLERKFDEEFEPIFLYAHLKADEDLTDQVGQEKEEILEMIYQKFAVETSFISTQLHELSDKFLDSLIKDKEFAEYNRSFEQIKREKSHMLSPKEEKLIAGMSFLGGFSSNSRLVSDADMSFNKVKDENGKEHVLDHNTYLDLIRGGDRTLRKNAMQEYNGAFGKLINMLSNNYICYIKEDCYMAKVRNYPSALEESLEDEEVTKKVYEMLMKKVEENLDILFKYFTIKQKALGLKDFAIYDNMASLGKKASKKNTFEQAIEIVKKAVEPLGEEYVSLIQKAKDERWIDVYPNKSKRTGAYQTGIYDVHPYVLTNFTGDLDSIYTLAHELGHAMHSYFTSRSQPRAKSNYTIFLAEIASTTNEILLTNYLLDGAKTKDEKVELFNKLFDEIKGSIYRQCMFAEFEALAHKAYEEGEVLTRDNLCNLYMKLNKKYFGKAKLIDEIKYEWARVGHFFSSFYVYKYATGMICAFSFANRILSGESGALEDYHKFLSAGDSLPPLEILKNSKCDLEKEETFDECFAYIKTMIKKWEALVK